MYICAMPDELRSFGRGQPKILKNHKYCPSIGFKMIYNLWGLPFNPYGKIEKYQFLSFGCIFLQLTAFRKMIRMDFDNNFVKVFQTPM